MSGKQGWACMGVIYVRGYLHELRLVCVFCCVCGALAVGDTSMKGEDVGEGERGRCGRGGGTQTGEAGQMDGWLRKV